MTRRLLLSYLTITFLVLALFEIPLAINLARVDRERLLSDIERRAFLIASFSEEALEADTPFDLTMVGPGLVRPGERVLVVDQTGVSVADTGAEVPTGLRQPTRRSPGRSTGRPRRGSGGPTPSMTTSCTWRCPSPRGEPCTER